MAEDREASLRYHSNRAKIAEGKKLKLMLEAGLSLEFRAGKRLKSWTAYWEPLDTPKGERGKRFSKTLGIAPDNDDLANGTDILTFSQASGMAREWARNMKRLSHLESLGEEITDISDYTVADAMKDYLEYRQRTGRRAKGVPNDSYSINAWIIPPLGRIPVKDLTKRRIEKWMDWFAVQPRRGGGQVNNKAPRTPEEKRQRKDTVNRVLNMLKAALNRAIKNDMNLARETAPHEWNYVEPYSGVAGSREGQLSLADHQRLLNAMEPDFRALAMASSFTAARHNELITLKCKNFKNGVVIVEAQHAKSGKTRAIPLSSAGVEFFTQMTKGKMPDAPIFTRSNGRPWIKDSQKRLMVKACITAGFTEDQRIRFHELKHVRVSMLSNAGLELDLLQAVVGNTDARTLADHYIHLKDERITSRLEAVAGEYDRAILKGVSQRQVIVPLRRTRVPDEDE